MGLEAHTTADCAKFQVERSSRTRQPDQPNIRQRRIALGLMQKQLAHAAGVSGCVLSYAERGDTFHYGPNAAQKIEAALCRLEARRKMIWGGRRGAREQQLHRACAEYLAWALKPPAWFSTFPAGGGGETRGKILRGLGLKPGVPDLLIVFSGVAHWVELKTPQGKVSADQVICHGDLIDAGCPVATVRSLDELQATLDHWLIPVRARMSVLGSIAGEGV